MSDDSINRDFVAYHISPVAGLDISKCFKSLPATQRVKEVVDALDAFGRSRRLNNLPDLSPATYKEMLTQSFLEYGLDGTIEKIYHAARRGWGAFYFTKEETDELPPY